MNKSYFVKVGLIQFTQIQKPSWEFFIFFPLLAPTITFHTFAEPATCTRKYTVSYRVKRIISKMVSSHMTPY